jgi:hypothetical protein
MGYWRNRGFGPKEYCEGVSGGRISHITEAEMQSRINALPKSNDIRAMVTRELADVYCCVEWETPYYRQCESFWGRVIPRLLRLGLPEDVRIVFWFDS